MADIAATRLDPETLARNFSDAHPPLTPAQAAIEADRCFHCYDAPCIDACPTSIDIPGFIGRIATGDLGGAARAILDKNILGGACARVCPTDILCEGACVRVKQGERAVEIGALQRIATDWQMERGQPYSRAASRGTRIAIVGAGPAGLACAHRLAMLGHDVDLYDARDKPGGLNEYGIAAYKVADDFAAREIAFLMEIGGITWHAGQRLGDTLSLEALRAQYDAVFLGLGQTGARRMGIEGENLPGVHSAIDFIENLRQSPPANIPIGARVVVIGGGNTAIDAAIQAKRLGAEDVTLAYRRGPQTMSATPEEQAFARDNGVFVRHWLQPEAIEGDATGVRSVRFSRAGHAEPLAIEADMVLVAIGQLLGDTAFDGLTHANGRIAVDAHHETALPRVYAGGDCTAGEDLTVAAVRDGRDAAHSIDRMLHQKGR